MKWGIFSVLSVTVTITATNLASLFLFGNITGNFVYPVMSAARYVSFADFFENLEAVVMAIWIAGTCIKLGFYHYVVVLSTAQWLTLSDYKPLALPFGIWVAPNFTELSNFISATLPFAAFIFFIAIQVTLLIVAAFRNKNRMKS